MKEGWEYKKLGDVCDIICGQDYKALEKGDCSYPIYGTGGIMGYTSQYRCPANSVIIGRKGNINNPLFVEEPFWNVDTAFGVVPNYDIILPKFFYYFCCNYNFLKHDVSVTIPSLRRTDLLKVEIQTPPIDQQHRIVSELDLLSSIIEKQKNQLKELDTLAQSIFYDMFGDPVTNEKGWDVSNLEHICDFYNGKAHEQNIVDNGSYILVNSKFISTNGNVYKYSDTQLFPLYVNDIAMVMSDVPDGKALAKCFLVTQNNKFTLNQRICAFRNYQQNPIYLLYFLNRNNYFLSYNDGKGQTNLRKQEVIDCPVLLPPLPLQQQFAEKIQSIETQKTTISKSIAESEKLFDYTMDKYFG